MVSSLNYVPLFWGVLKIVGAGSEKSARAQFLREVAIYHFASGLGQYPGVT